MGTIADSLFSALMSWVRALVSSLWALFSGESSNILAFFGRNWLIIAGVIIAAGLVIDWLVWLIRWQPYHIWAQRVRRLLGMEKPQEEKSQTRAHAAVSGRSIYARPQEPAQHEAQEEEFDHTRPLFLPVDEAQEAAAFAQAEQVSDEELGAYPGMRYGAAHAQNAQRGDTNRYAAVSVEGPGAAEVSRRRAEIDAWQQQMQEESRAKAAAELAEKRAEQERLAREAYEEEQERLAQEAYEAEQARLAQEAYEAEQARLAQEAYEAEQARLAQEAYEAEQARLAQEAYERELAEYEIRRAQYEQELAEYERQKAQYEAQLAQQQADTELAEEPAHSGARRRRAARRAYSDYAPEEAVESLPDAPAWPDAQKAVQDVRAKTKKKPAKAAQENKKGALMSRMAHMIEAEETEIPARVTLPPRVDPEKAYRPAKTPRKPGGRA